MRQGTSRRGHVAGAVGPGLMLLAMGSGWAIPVWQLWHKSAW